MLSRTASWKVKLQLSCNLLYISVNTVVMLHKTDANGNGSTFFCFPSNMWWTIRWRGVRNYLRAGSPPVRDVRSMDTGCEQWRLLHDSLSEDRGCF
ncbi:hypothetical protein AVEN_46054-1 [Araneus ventricosus]|uniref:Uncharacterized protein n=1 Tax=Araneus ventricosus TaxID=182803 RepID=A0A4Y2NF89_ARAVE|nr:hypothetical protein AVEN_46054-1 [Araneus ventricosus]